MKKTFFIMLVAALMCVGGVQAQSTKQTHKVHENPTIVADAPLFDALLLPFRGKTVLVDIWATWCGPCKMLSPVLDDLSDEIDIDIIKLDVDKHSELAREYGVMSIPTLIVFENNNEVKRTLGFMDKDKLKEFIK